MTRIGTFDPDRAQRVWAATLAYELGGSARPDERLFSEQEPILVRNTSGHTIPPFGLMLPKDCFDQPSSYNYIDAVRPFDYDANLAVVLVNGFNEIPDGEFGTAQNGPVFRVVHDAAITYSVGDRLGCVDNSFLAGLGPLFRVLGEDDIAENCLRVMSDFSLMMGQSISSMADGAAGTIYRRKRVAGGAWSTDTSKSYPARNDTGSSIPANSRLWAEPCDGIFSIVRVC
jgi:hypothetical protein